MPIPCNPPPPPSGGGGWGESWGGSWGQAGGSASWDANNCLDITFIVPPPLNVDYRVPIILDASYSVIYASPLTIEQSVPPPLGISYDVPAKLDVSYSVVESWRLSVRYEISQPLGIDYDSGESWRISASYQVLETGALTSSFDVSGPLSISYVVPTSVLPISFDVPADHRSLVVQFNVRDSFQLPIWYSVESGSSRQPLTAQYTVVDPSVSSGNLISYYVVGALGDTCPGATTGLAGVLSLTLSSQEGGISMQASVVPSHPWASATVGDDISVFAAGRHFSLRLASRTFDESEGVYRIEASATVDDLLGKEIARAGSDGRLRAPGIFSEDPVRKKIEHDGSVCREDIPRLRASHERPTVGGAIRTALSAMGRPYRIIGLFGLGDKVPFDVFSDQKVLTVADVLSTLVGWQRPYYFLNESGGVTIVGGAASEIRGTPPAIDCDTSAGSDAIKADFTEKNVLLPKDVYVSGGPWPEKLQAASAPSDCASTSPDPSEQPTVVIRSTTRAVSTTKVDDKVFNLVRFITHETYKECGRIVKETGYEYGDVLMLDLFSDLDNPQFRILPITLARETVDYEHVGECKDAWVRRTRTVKKNGIAIAEGIDAKLAAAMNAYTDYLFEMEEEYRDWAPKGYLRSRTIIRTKFAGAKLSTRHGTTGDESFLTDIKYKSTVEVEEWHPLGNGLWLHTQSVSEEPSYPILLDPEVDEEGVGMMYASPTTTRTVNEVTDAQPTFSDCVAMMGCSEEKCLCGKTSSPSEGLTRYYAEVPIAGGTVAPISITVPGINRYSPMPVCCEPDSISCTKEYKPPCEPAPEMSVSTSQDYATTAAVARKVVATLRRSVIDVSPAPIAGDILEGGLVTSSTIRFGDGKVLVDYTIEWTKA